MIAVRFADERDAAAMAALYAPYVEGSHVSFEERAPDAAAMSARLLEGQRFAPWLVAYDEAAFAGFAYASPHRARAAYRWSVEVSVYVEAARRRRGAARALYRELFALLATQGFVNAYAGIALPNDESVGLHESLGFVLVGVYANVGYKLGAWRDVGWWGKDLGLLAGEPREPLRPRDLVEHPAWRKLTRS